MCLCEVLESTDIGVEKAGNTNKCLLLYDYTESADTGVQKTPTKKKKNARKVSVLKAPPTKIGL